MNTKERIEKLLNDYPELKASATAMRRLNELLKEQEVK